MEATALELDADDADAKAKEITGEITRAEATAQAIVNNVNINTEVRVVADALKSYRTSLEKYQADLNELNQDGGATEATDPAMLAARVEGAKVRREEARAAIDKFKTIEATRGTRTKAEADRQKLDQQLADLKDLQKDVKGYADKALEDLTGTILAPFTAAAMASFGCPAFLEILNSAGKPVVDFGIAKENGARVSYDTMSGGERVVILADLLADLQIAMSGKIRNKPRLLLAELAEADRNRVGSLVTAIREIGFEQAVLATCHDAAISPESGIDFIVMDGQAQGVDE
jgi:hypothetical protein